MLTPGALLQNRYRLLGQIGGGGMGTVYLAEDIRLPARRCAIKELLPAQISSQDRAWAVQAFQQEAHMLSGLHHPGLTPVTDFFTEWGNWYLVMDYVDGETLQARLQREPAGRLSLQESLGLVRQLCDVLEYLHGQTPPVIFRDLKPGNVMLTPQGQVKLIDFGIARFFKPSQQSDTVNLGTPGYAAPEQYGSLGQSDARTDIYSLGVLLHQMLTGYDPITTPMQLPSAKALNPGVSQRIEAVIQRATQTRPAQRFQSVQEFRQALFTQAGRLSRGQRTALVGLSMIASIAVIIFVIWGTRPQNAASSTVAPPATPTGVIPAPSIASPVVPTPTREPKPTATPDLPSPVGEQVVTVIRGEGLFDICYRHCPSLVGYADAMHECAERVAARNNLPGVDQDPILKVGQKLVMPPCPQVK